MNYGVSRTQNTPAQGNSSKTGMIMRCDNAYLPQTGLFGQRPDAAADPGGLLGGLASSQTAGQLPDASISANAHHLSAATGPTSRPTS